MAMQCPNCGKRIKTDAGMAFHSGWCKPAVVAAVTTAEPVREIRRGPADAECDMLSGRGWTLPRADAERMGLIAAGAPATPAEPRTVVDYSTPAGFRFEPVAALEPDPDPDPEPDPPAASQPVPADYTGPVQLSPSLAASLNFAAGISRVARKPRAAVPARDPLPKLAKLPATGTGKHARCVEHVRVARTAPGVGYMCFDVAPDAEAIDERRAFVAAVDDSWQAHHDIELSRPVPEPTAAAQKAVKAGRAFVAGVYASRPATAAERSQRLTRDAADLAAIRARESGRPTGYGTTDYSAAA